jgi:hypothetical protein
MQYSIILFAIFSLALANPYPQSECTSNGWEKVHEGHGHNINGKVPGALNIPLPGGTGCYKGKKVGPSGQTAAAIRL